MTLRVADNLIVRWPLEKQEDASVGERTANDAAGTQRPPAAGPRGKPAKSFTLNVARANRTFPLFVSGLGRLNPTQGRAEPSGLCGWCCPGSGVWAARCAGDGPGGGWYAGARPGIGMRAGAGAGLGTDSLSARPRGDSARGFCGGKSVTRGKLAGSLGALARGAGWAGTNFLSTRCSRGTDRGAG